MNYTKENSDVGKSHNSFSLKSNKRRLDLLFGNNYTLETESDGNKNLLKLIINL
jgi:sensor histidine kinase YesM